MPSHHHPSPAASLPAQRGRALVAAMLAVALVALALVGAAALPARAAAGPSLSVTPTTVADPSVATTFTVTGSGFVGDGAADGAYVLLGPASTWHGEGPLPGAGWIAQGWVQASQIVDGAFTTTIVAPAGTLTAGVAYQVATSAAHALSATNRSLDAFAAITVPSPEPTTPTEPTEPTEPTTPPTTPPAPVFTPSLAAFAADGTTPLGSAPVTEGASIVVRGSGFDPAANVGGRGAPIPATLPQGTYVVLGRALDAWKPSQGAPSTARKVADQRWALASSVLDQVPSQFQSAIRGQWVDVATDGTFTATLTVKDAVLAGGRFGVFTYAAGGTVNATQELFVPVTLASVTPDPGPTTPAPTPTPVTPTTPGQLTWGVKASFRAYVTGAAAGAIATGDGATASNGTYVFSQGSTTVDATTGLGTVGYGGSVRFTGHSGALDLTFSSPRVAVTSAGAATLVVDVRSGSTSTPAVALASLNLAGATFATASGVQTWTGAPATLTAAGSAAFGDMYPAGTVLDPVTFSVGTNATTTPTPTPTAGPSSGVATINVAQAAPGGAVTIGGDGFGADEQGLTVLIRSTPRTLATNVSANASGAVSVTVTIPADMPAGEHTLSIEGANHVVQVPITIVAAAPAAPTCTARAVSGASLRWGVKSSFNSYVTGPIADGSIATTGGVTASGGVYAWTGGTGSFNTDRTLGSASFRGGVTYSGHAGTLDLRLTNPRVVINGGTGTLVVDVLSTDTAGTATTKSGVTFATLSLAGHGSVSGSSATWSGVPATLTAAGADAFAGYYGAGESLDPVAFTLPLGATVACTALTGSLSSTGANSALLGLVALVLVATGAGAVVASRRRAGTTA